MKCPNCGNPAVKNGVCEYCGSVFEADFGNEPITVYIDSRPLCREIDRILREGGGGGSGHN